MDLFIYRSSVNIAISDIGQNESAVFYRGISWGIPVVPIMSSVLSGLYSAPPFQHYSFTTPLFIHNQCGQYRGVLGAVSIL